ncbi:MAG: hypothetical protein BGN97_11245 [Microbacterium sp. 69-10]|uniref:hypothetical protein n=1 Tax=Microbacterium sp. 69-10 TaxID=1895783 RepID=UPI0009651C19|nr:hypothetical protein [Microbacterium sp. 69-10]OJU40410.1 MAG: hypothetical protein BGN97_11245 [Microbacterium sp. 69-10]
MQDENTKAPRQIERRTILKGAAWSAPVIAAAVAAPAYAASGQTFDVRVQRESCVLASVTVNKKPYFNIYADSGTIPAGSVFQLTVTNGLVNLGLFQSDPNAGYNVVDLGILSGKRVYQITTAQDITPTTPMRVDYLPDSFASVFAGQNAQLTYVSSPSGTESGPGRNSDTMSVSGVALTIPFLGTIRAYSCSA